MSDNPHQDISDHFLADGTARSQYQHEYTIAGLKTLILINGGAIIGLLTYAGNAAEAVEASQFSSAFFGYIGGLVAAMLSYLAAYSSQGELMNGSMLEAYRLRGLDVAEEPDPAKAPKTKQDFDNRGMAYVHLGIVLAVLSLVGFGVGSYFAGQAIQTSSQSREIHELPAPAPALTTPGR